jgi:membrane protein DedA with SNARE-associated domain
VALSLLLAAFILGDAVDGTNRLRVFAEQSPGWAYVTVFLLVFADGICALFPAETTLNAASALVAEGALDLGAVMVAGALGAVGGDSALYWLARLSRQRFQAQLDRTLQNDKVASAMAFIGSSAPLLLCVGRYVPGLRFVVNASCGLSLYPYRQFLLWSAIGGTAWSVVTCSVAYLVATALAGYPLAAVVVSGCVSTVAIAFIFLIVRRRRRTAASRAAGA